MSESRQAELEAVLRGIEERLPHRDWCVSQQPMHRLADGSLIQWQPLACTCDRPVRVRAEQARTVERMLEAAINGDTVFADGSYFPDKRDRATKWAAALRAGEEPQ